MTHADPGREMDDERLRADLTSFGFYHTIQLTQTVSTPGWPVVVPIVEMVRRVMRRVDLARRRVLDIGCRDGILSFDAEALGACEVLGIDNDLNRPAVDFLVDWKKSRVSFLSRNLFDLTADAFGRFDAVIFAGVLYHLRYPFRALKLIREIMTDGAVLILETAVFVDDNRFAMLHCPIGGESPYEPTSCSFFNAKGLRDTLASVGFAIEHEECLLRIPQGAPASSGRLPIDRCAMVCRRLAHHPDPDTESYWSGAAGTRSQPAWNKRPNGIAG